jgi:acyl transferase domain-containing protein/SAM-dependent methyltransferase
MKDFLQRIENLSPKHLQLLALEQQKRLEKLERAQREPVAIVGIGCRFPGGVHGPDSFWELLSESRDAITEIPSDRWDVDGLYDVDPEAPGRISTRRGGFLRDVDKFDAAFFGISRREAISMDPQQRLLLETTWEALEHAGIAAKDIAGSQTGLFFGLSTADYCQLLLREGYELIDPYTATGGCHSIAAGRVAYVLGTQGPAIVVDTSCSSSLTALHLACQSLRTGECNLALAGGVNLILSPESMIALSKARMLSSDGRCKAFDAAADGFGRAEGCGVIVLKTLSRAMNDRDNILGVIRGSAVNQDGRSSGLTAPNGTAQEKLIRQAMEAAGVKAEEIQYVEAHGTGTSLGDPIEAHALAAVFGVGRDARNPLYLGSVKTNLGHLEAAAGMAGVIKTVLSLQHGKIPASLHFSRLNPHIDLNGAPLIVAAEMLEWPRVERRVAGVSSFGFSGTNAHVILEAPPQREREPESTAVDHVLVISARTATALRALAGRYASHLASNPGISLRDLCYTAASGRTRFEHVLALSANSVEDLRDKLVNAAEGHEVPRIEPPALQLSGNRIAVPTYPFEGQRYWIEARSAQSAPKQSEVDFYKLDWESKPTRPAPPSGAKVNGNHADASRSHSEGRETLAPGAVAAITETVATQFNLLSSEHGLDRYGELRPELDRLTFEQIARALRECGWNPAAGDVIDVKVLAERLGVPQRHVRLLGRMLEILGEEAVLERHGQSWKVVRTPAAGDSRADFPLLQAAYPQFRNELELLHRCCSKLADILRDRIDPLNVLFPDAGFETTEAIYETSAGAKVFQTLVQRAIVQAIETIPSDRPLRILEVGGGTGGTASYVARILPAERAEYVFTDISPLFATRGAEKFRDYRFFRFEVLDIERDPAAQGFAGQTFDIVIAANCLHATGDLRVSLKNVAQLLAPGGMLVLLEATLRERWVDITFGLTDGWWKFTDTDLRGDYPLLSKSSWQKLLEESGFSETAVLPHDPESQQAMLIARGPAMKREKEKNWFLIADSGGMASQIAVQLAARGERAVIVRAGDALTLDRAAWNGIVDLSALDFPAAEEMTDRDWDHVHLLGCDRLLALTRSLVQTGGQLWVVTRGSQRVGSEVMGSAIAGAPLWGLGRTIALEHPGIWGGLIDLDPSESAKSQAGVLIKSLTATDGEDQIAFRAGTRHVARLKRHDGPAQVPASFNADRSYLITGGLGGLGLVVARWMVEHGARRLILVGRSGIKRPDQANTVRELESLGASVRLVQADVADPQQMAQLFASIATEEPPLAGVIHAAAALSRDKARDMSLDTLREVLRPKVRGTWLLHRHTRDMDLDFFCLFSSTSSLLGAGGLAHYAAANQFLDAFAEFRRGQGLPALAIEWGTWDEMRAVSEEERQEYRSLGLLPMAGSRALDALGNLLHSQESCVVAAAINWSALRAVFESRRKRPLLEGMAAQPARAATRNEVEPGLHKLLGRAREAGIATIVWEEICRVLRVEENLPMELDRGFFEMGMDSLVSVELKNRLERRLGLSLPPMLTFNFPTVRALTNRLSEEFVSPQHPASGNGTRSAPLAAANEANDEEVADLLAAKLKSLGI